MPNLNKAYDTMKHTVVQHSDLNLYVAYNPQLYHEEDKPSITDLRETILQAVGHLVLCAGVVRRRNLSPLLHR